MNKPKVAQAGRKSRRRGRPPERTMSLLKLKRSFAANDAGPRARRSDGDRGCDLLRWFASRPEASLLIHQIMDRSDALIRMSGIGRDDTMDAIRVALAIGRPTFREACVEERRKELVVVQGGSRSASEESLVRGLSGPGSNGGNRP